MHLTYITSSFGFRAYFDDPQTGRYLGKGLDMTLAKENSFLFVFISNPRFLKELSFDKINDFRKWKVIILHIVVSSLVEHNNMPSMYKTFINFQKKPSKYITNFLLDNTYNKLGKGPHCLSVVVIRYSNSLSYIPSTIFVFNESIYFSSQESTPNNIDEETLQTLLFSSYLFLSFERHITFSKHPFFY